MLYVVFFDFAFFDFALVPLTSGLPVSVASARLSERLRRAYLESVIHQDAHYFETVGAGEAATRLVKDIGLVKSAAGEKLGFIAWG